MRCTRCSRRTWRSRAAACRPRSKCSRPRSWRCAARRGAMRRSALLLAVVAVGTLHAQDADASRVPRYTVTARARQLVQSGKEVEGRKLVDSVLTTLTPDSARYGGVLYWHGMLA